MIRSMIFSRPGLKSTTENMLHVEKAINHLLSTFMQRRDIMRDSTLRNDFSIAQIIILVLSVVHGDERNSFWYSIPKYESKYIHLYLEVYIIITN